VRFPAVQEGGACTSSSSKGRVSRCEGEFPNLVEHFDCLSREGDDRVPSEHVSVQKEARVYKGLATDSWQFIPAPHIFFPAPPHSYEKTKSPLLVFKILEISLT